MSFNIDDPLAGILSDGSDDSFFDDDILGKKKPVKKKGTPTPEKKSALFNLDVDKPSTSISEAKKDSLFDLGKPDVKSDEPKASSFKPVSPAPFKRTLSKESVKFDSKKPVETAKSPAKAKISASADSLDILGDLNFDTKKDAGQKSIEKGKSSQSLLDDILGGSSVKTPSSTQITRPATAAKSQEFDFDSILGKSESKPSVSSKNVPSKQPAKTEKPKDVAPKKKTSEDWLGIFQDKEENEDATDMPSWLGGGDSKKKKAANTETKEPPQKAKEVAKEEERDVVTEKEKVKESVVEPMQTINPMLKPVELQGSNEDLTAEGAAMYMQEQESQLMVALQLKAQEEKLASMQMRQNESQRLHREAARAHHDQLDAMLQRQMQHRAQMQAIISAHQERISQRIKALLGTSNTEENILNSSDELDATPGERKESPHIKEKKQLLQLVQSLQENHDKEIDLMETSYRRQLAFLEVSLSQGEERMKEESEKLSKFYSEKIHWLEEHQELYKKLTEENLTALTERHKAENEMLRQQHLENVRILQEHHATLMDNIKNAVKQEQTLIQDAAGFSSNLQELVSDVKENKTQFQQLVDRVQSLAENTQRDAERSVESRQTQINDMIQQLKTDRENFEKEKIESREIVKLLESRLKQMNESIEEEMANMKQKKMEFEFEKATFNKQTEFAKNVLKKQDEEIKMVKEDMQREFREKIDKLNEEKMHVQKDSIILAKEKASIQSIKQELEKMKAELQAQMEEVAEDRLRLNLEKQQSHMDEQRIMAKGRDLELLVKAAMEKQSQADKKYSEAELIQSKYEERIRRIQEHAVSLNAREKQIAKEKVSLSRERLALHNEKKQMESRQQCSLCKSTQQVPLYNFETANTFPDSYHNVSVSRDEGDSNVMSAMKAIAQELVSLKLKKQMDLRQRSELSRMSISGHDGRHVEEIGPQSDSLQPQSAMESTSGGFKDYMDPKFMMLRLDIQKMFGNLDRSDKEGGEDGADEKEE
ncbi:fas-binding factor 1 homolog [Ostrinia furnacalis]|uniref:fas-binding factor 1 homolog n=1 Tax=Ostrinia furnacalis TaxID=93504 RepID=UPI00103F0303|nr:fas-binding factor 1 homolog [Ostrinia furnacalis]